MLRLSSDKSPLLARTVAAASLSVCTLKSTSTDVLSSKRRREVFSVTALMMTLSTVVFAALAMPALNLSACPAKSFLEYGSSTTIFTAGTVGVLGVEGGLTTGSVLVVDEVIVGAAVGVEETVGSGVVDEVMGAAEADVGAAKEEAEIVGTPSHP